MKQNLKGQVALVTGASSGIGAAIAVALAKKGVNLALLARNEERLQKVAEKARSFGVDVLCHLADTRNTEQVNAAVAETIAHFGHLDIACCNAGIYFRCPTPELTTDQIRKVMETNFYGNLNTAYAVLPHMQQRHSGSIIVTVSMDGKKGVPPDAAYVASKFALNGFFQVMRQEVRNSGIHVGMLFPSRTDTPQLAHVDCPKVTPKVSPAVMGNAVVRMLEHRKKEMMVPCLPCKFLAWGDTISPSLGDFLIRFLKLDGKGPSPADSI